MKKNIYFIAAIFTVLFSFFISGCGTNEKSYEVGIISNQTNSDFYVYDVKFPEKIYEMKAKRSLRFPCYEDTSIKLTKPMDDIDIEYGIQFLDESQILASKFVIYEYKKFYHRVKVPEEFEVPIIFEYEFKSVTLNPGDEYEYYSYFNDYKFYYHNELEDEEGIKTDLIVEDITFEESEASKL